MDATRIAGGDGGLWRDIFLDNADHLRASAGRLHKTLSDLLLLLDPSRSDDLRRWLDTAADRRERLVQAKLRELNSD